MDLKQRNLLKLFLLCVFFAVLISCYALSLLVVFSLFRKFITLVAVRTKSFFPH